MVLLIVTLSSMQIKNQVSGVSEQFSQLFHSPINLPQAKELKDNRLLARWHVTMFLLQ